MGTLQSQTGKLAAVLLIGLAVSLAIASFIGRYKDHIAHASGRIPSREIVPAGRIFPPFFSAHGRSRTSFPEAARVRFWQRERFALGRWTGTISREADLSNPDDHKFTESAVILAAQDEWGACSRSSERDTGFDFRFPVSPCPLPYTCSVCTKTLFTCANRLCEIALSYVCCQL